MTSQTFDHPFFARFWTVMSAHESGVMKKMRKDNLAGLTGRVLEVGAGTGTNFAFYPDTVTEVVALEPETRLAPHAKQAAASAPVPVTVIESPTGQSWSPLRLLNCCCCCNLMTPPLMIVGPL